MKKSFTLLSLIPLSVLFGCQTSPQASKEIAQTLDHAIASHEQKKAPKPLTQVPSNVQQALMAHSMSQARDSLLAEKRLEISANAVHPDVSGKITVNLKDVTLDEALSVIQDLYGYDIRKSERVIQVYPAGMRTETIPLNYLFVKRFGLSSTSINSGGVSENDPNSNNNNSSNNNSFSMSLIFGKS